MKLIAFYLPQFHEIPENNDWWGQGFTEWVNVKKAKSLFVGHRQPRVPLNGNYYNLLDPKTQMWQAKTAQEYGIYGFCYYHYWFKGKKLLEKPTEAMLSNKAVNIPFMIAWANEAWTKSWHGAKGSKEILMRQNYGNERDWEEHYSYLRQFFLDDRYIKINNNPVILIYKLKNVRHRSEMFNLWNELAQKDGFKKIHLLEMLSQDVPASKLRYVCGTVDFEPGKSRNIMRSNQSGIFNFRNELRDKYVNINFWNKIMCDIIDYNTFNRKCIETPHQKGQYRCVFPDYDDSPRRGKKALFFKGATPEKFQQFLQEQIRLSLQENNEYLFINAWNEWGESNYLEPDTKNGYEYLSAVKKALEVSI